MSETITSPEEENEAFALNRFTLTFRDPELEKRFSAETLVNTIVIVRIAIFAGLCLYASFGVLDVLTITHSLNEVLFIRYGVVCPVVAAVLLSTWTKFFFRHPQVLLGSAMTMPGIGICLMTMVLPPPYNSFYYAGLIMVVIYCGCSSPALFRRPWR